MRLIFRIVLYLFRKHSNIQAKKVSQKPLSGNTKNEKNIPGSFSVKNFGKDFTWGTATAAFQTEGAVNADGKGESIWDKFSAQPSKVNDSCYASSATDFYFRYREDIDLLNKMNFDALRFSISWPRILPEGTGRINPKGIDFYNRLIDYCLEKNIAPWATAYHWDLPQVLENKKGWQNRDILNWFAEYIQLITQKFGDRVKNWMVLNEPMAYTSLGYLFGVHAPGKHGFRHFLPAVHHSALCQALGGKIIRDNVKGSNIGTTFSCSVAEPINDNPKNQVAARRIDAALNRLFIEPALGLGYPMDDLPFLKKIEKYFQPNDMYNLKFDFDFIGLQYYYRVMIRYHKLPPFYALEVSPAIRGVPVNEMGFEIYPQGIYEILKKFASYKNIRKIILTESGTCYRDFRANSNTIEDYERAGYHQNILWNVLKAKKEGIPVDGYFVWSLTDNFEWKEGIGPRFGLIYIDYNTQERILKNSGKWFQNFLANQHNK